MSKTSFTASAVNLARMMRRREIAREMGFYSPDGSDAPMVHSSDLLVLAVTDPEGSWRLSIKERHPMRIAGQTGDYTLETGSVELSNLTEIQFRAFLIAAKTSVGIW
jgi:hypothetical protein